MKRLNTNWLITIAIIFLIVTKSISQHNVSNSLMASASHSAERPNLSISNSFGEVFIFSQLNNEIYFNQGFHNIERNELVSVNGILNDELSASIFPNPAQNNINIDAKIEFSTAEIFSHNGMLIKSIGIAYTNQIDISELQAGLYFIQLITDDHIKYSGKFLKI